MPNQPRTTYWRRTFQMGLSAELNLELSGLVVSKLKALGLHVTTVESCTGGDVAGAITDTPGASDVLKDAFVTYCDEAKIALGVPAEIIERHTVYSRETAQAMAEAGLKRSVRADIGVGITGQIVLSDPSDLNPAPGSIYLAVKYGDKVITKELSLSGHRRFEIKLRIVEEALRMILWATTPLRSAR